MVTDTWPPPKRLWSKTKLSKSETDELADLREIILNLRAGSSPSQKFMNGNGQWTVPPGKTTVPPGMTPEVKWFEDRYAELVERMRL